ncbi:hypothetical protein H0H92_003358, partial [Tricholoma furcatifolium]
MLALAVLVLAGPVTLKLLMVVAPNPGCSWWLVEGDDDESDEMRKEDKSGKLPSWELNISSAVAVSSRLH